MDERRAAPGPARRAGRVRPERDGARVGGPPPADRRRGACSRAPSMPGVDSIVPDFQYLAERRERAARHPAHPRPRGPHRRARLRARRRRPRPSTAAGSRSASRGGACRSAAVERRPAPAHAGPARRGRARSASTRSAWRTACSTASPSPSRRRRAWCSRPATSRSTAQAPAEERTDLDALSAWGDRGVLVLLSDSTNVEQRGRTGGEDDVLPAFQRDLRAHARARCSSPASRPRSRASSAWPTWRAQAGRSIGFVGRRMADNAEVAARAGPAAHPARRLGRPRARSASTRPAALRAVRLGQPGRAAVRAVAWSASTSTATWRSGPGDTVVLSARPIPGNERAVSRVIGNLFRRGCDVVHGGTAAVHVSGHASQDDLVELLQPRAPALPRAHPRRVPHARAARAPGRGGRAARRPRAAGRGRRRAGLRRRRARARRRACPPGRMLLDRSGDGGAGGAWWCATAATCPPKGIVVPVVVLDKQTGRAASRRPRS